MSVVSRSPSPLGKGPGVRSFGHYVHHQRWRSGAWLSVMPCSETTARRGRRAGPASVTAAEVGPLVRQREGGWWALWDSNPGPTRLKVGNVRSDNPLVSVALSTALCRTESRSDSVLFAGHRSLNPPVRRHACGGALTGAMDLFARRCRPSPLASLGASAQPPQDRRNIYRHEVGEAGRRPMTNRWFVTVTRSSSSRASFSRVPVM